MRQSSDLDLGNKQENGIVAGFNLMWVFWEMKKSLWLPGFHFRNCHLLRWWTEREDRIGWESSWVKFEGYVEFEVSVESAGGYAGWSQEETLMSIKVVILSQLIFFPSEWMKRTEKTWQYISDSICRVYEKASVRLVACGTLIVKSPCMETFFAAGL